jgi:hypothetical protein
MAIEPRDLIAARRLLSQFAAEIERSEALARLSEALSLLADVAMDAASAGLKQTCSNIVSTYARKVEAKVHPLLAQESPVHQETIEHWLRVFSEFGHSGFALPSTVTECHSALSARQVNQIIEAMSPAQAERLFQLLKAKFGDPAS